MISEARRSELIHMVSLAGDRYGGGPNGLLSLMDETKHQSTREVTDQQLLDFCKRHGITHCEREKQTA